MCGIYVNTLPLSTKEIANCRWQQTMALQWAKFCYYVNKVLLEYNHAHIFLYYPGCFWAVMEESRGCNTDHVALKLKIFTIWPCTPPPHPTPKNWPTSGL